MRFKKPVLPIFGRVLALVLSLALMVQLAGCARSTPEVDLLSGGQSAPAAAIDSIPHTTGESAIVSPYAGQEGREIKALSPEDIGGLLAGAGTPFGGMAKPAELNGYPGPRNVLDAVEAGEFLVSEQQMDKIESLYGSMRLEAIGIGEEIIELETTVDDAFAERSISGELLQESIFESGRLRSQLRMTHLQTHLSMVESLTPDQVERYNKLRGYVSGNLCDNIPEGHSAELWKKHNNCN